MTRGILIAGNNSPLLNAVAVETVKRVEHFVAALIPNGDRGDRTLTISGVETLNWNPGSPIAAKTLVLAAENRLKQIDEAILICAPPALCALSGQINHTEIESLVNDQIKGWFLLAKELIASFRNRKTGTLALALAHADTEGDLLAPSAVASFQAFAQGLLNLAPSEPFQILGFSPPDTNDSEGFAAFIFKTIEEDSKKNIGRWLKFGKISFFGR
jgi:hypothetical protein